MEASNAHLDPRFHSFGPFKDTATVKINVLDVDEPPVFSKPSYTMDVYEDTPQGTIIGAVTAQDLDAGNSQVRYANTPYTYKRIRLGAGNLRVVSSVLAIAIVSLKERKIIIGHT